MSSMSTQRLGSEAVLLAMLGAHCKLSSTTTTSMIYLTIVSCLLPDFRAKMADSFTAQDTETGVDNYHYLSMDSQGGTVGVARAVSYNGWKYHGSVCLKSQKDRTAITEVLNPGWYTWNQQRMSAAQVR